MGKNHYRFVQFFECQFCGCRVPVSKTEFVFIPRFDSFLQVCELCAEQFYKSEDKGGK